MPAISNRPDSDCPSPAEICALLESVPALLWKADTELRLTLLTGGAEALNEASDLFSQAGGALNEEARRAHQVALTGQASSFGMDVNGRDLQAMVKPRYAPGGALIGVIGIAVDMTERMVAERALRLSEHGYRSLIEDAPYAICRSTIGGELLQVNRAMTEMLGYDAASGAELLLRDLPQIFIPAGSFEAFRKTVRDGGPHPGTDSVWSRRDGAAIEVRVSGRVVRGPSGEISHLDVFAENVTEVKRLETELGQAQRMQAIGQLAGGVAHDFNNLLTVIGGHVEMLLSDSVAGSSRSEPDETEAQASLIAIKEAAARAAVLTKQLLAFSRRQVLRNQTVNLNAVLRNLMGIITRVIKENVEVILIPGEKLGSVRADPNQIERVVLNLAVNAQDAMPGGGRLTIETSNASVDEQPGPQPEGFRAGDYVQMVVSDNGIGMDRETQARAFEPFFTTKQPNEGTGLGLSVVYGVVRQSGGYVRLESEPGVGTTLRIYLPRVGFAAIPAQAPLTAGTLPRGSETILFAEDHTAVRNLITQSLESLGYRVLSVPDGAAALEAAKSYPGEIHLLVSDFVMPALGGRELAATLKRADPRLKVVFISGYAGHTAAAKDLEVAGVTFLQKPFTVDLLAKTVRGVLDGILP